ncbi:hypothetical protein Taro_040896, partial [Colocasia esculenta]|nr:hypothetical protein [Colocasia esculenta]
GASALVTLMERIAHEVGMVLRPETLEVPGMDLQLCVCSEVCPGVGTIVIEWYLVVAGVVEELCSVKVVRCDLPFVVFSSFSEFACEACSLGNDLPVWLIA